MWTATGLVLGMRNMQLRLRVGFHCHPPAAVNRILMREGAHAMHTTLVLKPPYKPLLRHIHSCNDL